jgi:hypothetical protein
MQLFSTPFSLRTAALASLVVLGACSKKSEDTPTPAATYSASWTADGTNYTATTSTTNVSNNILQVALVQGTTNNTNFASLTVPAATGTYTLSNNNTYAAGYTVTAGGTTTSYGAGSGFGGSGTITITTFSTTEVIGTFSFVGANASNPGGPSKTITNGKFSIKR